MTYITVENINCNLRGALPPTVASAIVKDFSYLPEDAEYKLRQLRIKRKDPKLMIDFTVRLFRPVGNGVWTLPTGLLPRLLAILDAYNVEYEVEDREDFAGKGNPLSPWWNDKYAPRDYQRRAAARAVAEKRGIVQHCTGSGKTISIGLAIKEIDQAPALVVTHTTALLTQTQERLSEMLGMEIGLLGRKSGKAVRDIRPVTVCTTQTIDSLLKGEDANVSSYLSRVKQLHIDESHHTRAETVKRIVQLCPRAEYKIGWSGTPYREQGDDLEIEGALGSVIDEYTYSEAIDAGYIVPPHIYSFEFDSPYNYRGYSYQDVVKEYIVENEVRNMSIARIADILARQGERTLVLVNQIEHGKTLCGMIRGSKFVEGKSHAKYQRDVLEGLTSGEHPVVVATPLMDEGIDIPAVTAVIFAHPSKSLVKTYQRLGRVLRPYPGKTRAIVVDIYDSNVGYLYKQTERRMELYRREPRFVIKEMGAESPAGKPWYR